MECDSKLVLEKKPRILLVYEKFIKSEFYMIYWYITSAKTHGLSLKVFLGFVRRFVELFFAMIFFPVKPNGESQLQ